MGKKGTNKMRIGLRKKREGKKITSKINTKLHDAQKRKNSNKI